MISFILLTLLLIYIFYAMVQKYGVKFDMMCLVLETLCFSKTKKN